MRFLKALGITLATIMACCLFLAVWVFIMFVVDVHVLPYFGGPKGEGHGIWIVGGITIFVMYFVMVYDTLSD